MAKIMIVDDDTVMRGLLTTLLGMEGHEVAQTWQKERIVATAREEHPDLILIDLHLGGEDALPVIIELKNDPELHTVPLLAASGMDRQTECARVGADDFILKPFRPAELLDKINKLLSISHRNEASI